MSANQPNILANLDLIENLSPRDQHELREAVRDTAACAVTAGDTKLGIEPLSDDEYKIGWGPSEFHQQAGPDNRVIETFESLGPGPEIFTLEDLRKGVDVFNNLVGSEIPTHFFVRTFSARSLKAIPQGMRGVRAAFKKDFRSSEDRIQEFLSARHREILDLINGTRKNISVLTSGIYNTSLKDIFDGLGALYGPDGEEKILKFSKETGGFFLNVYPEPEDGLVRQTWLSTPYSRAAKKHIGDTPDPVLEAVNEMREKGRAVPIVLEGGQVQCSGVLAGSIYETIKTLRTEFNLDPEQAVTTIHFTSEREGLDNFIRGTAILAALYGSESVQQLPVDNKHFLIYIDEAGRPHLATSHKPRRKREKHGAKIEAGTQKNAAFLREELNGQIEAGEAKLQTYIRDKLGFMNAIVIARGRGLDREASRGAKGVQVGDRALGKVVKGIEAIALGLPEEQARALNKIAHGAEQARERIAATCNHNGKPKEVCAPTGCIV